nr:hypothetical protein PH0643 [Bradyrhizobium sp. DOA9]
MSASAILAPKSRQSSMIRDACATFRTSWPTSPPPICRVQRSRRSRRSLHPRCRSSPASRGSAYRSRAPASSSRLELRRSRGRGKSSATVRAHPVPEGDHLAQRRPERRCPTEGLEEVGLGSGARDGDRYPRLLCRARRRADVAGYCIVNDVSEREYQMERGGTWDKGKGCDTFGPVGPWLVTADENADPQALDVWLDVNGQRMQAGNTRTMIFECAEIVSYVSRFMTLMPGDVMTLGIEGLGEQRQQTREWSPAAGQRS